MMMSEVPLTSNLQVFNGRDVCMYVAVIVATIYRGGEWYISNHRKGRKVMRSEGVSGGIEANTGCPGSIHVQE